MSLDRTRHLPDRSLLRDQVRHLAAQQAELVGMIEGAEVVWDGWFVDLVRRDMEAQAEVIAAIVRSLGGHHAAPAGLGACR